MRNLTLASLFAFFSCGPALACIGPQFEDHHFPSCTIPLPEADEIVTVIYGDGPSELSTHHLGEPDSRTRLRTIHISNNNDKNYLVLSAYDQTIWRITGDTEGVSRVIVLGATKIGPDNVGIIGIPADRVFFTSPDPSALDGVQQTSCTRISNACIPAQWFGDAPGAQVTFHPAPLQPRQRYDDIISSRPNLRDNSRGIISIVQPDVIDALVPIDPTLVISPNTAQPYQALPGRPGLDALVASGALMPVTTDALRERIQAYGETFSQRYRSRFDPDYLFVPYVDYIVTREITLPPELPPTALMVASGAPAPDMNGNRGYSVCLYIENQAGNPVRGDSINSNLCRLNNISRAIPDKDQDTLMAAKYFDTLDIGARECQLWTFPEATHITAIALSEGRYRRYRNDPIRQIDVEITRTGPTVLFLSMEGGPVQWNISGPSVLEVYARGAASLGLTEVVLNGTSYEYTRLSSPTEGCPYFAPQDPNRLGPAIAQLDEMFELLTARRIDQLITFTDSGRAWRDADWPVPIYVID